MRIVCTTSSTSVTLNPSVEVFNQIERLAEILSSKQRT